MTRTSVSVVLFVLGFLVSRQELRAEERKDRFGSIQSFNFPKTHIRHQDGLGFASEISSELDRQDASWDVCPGLTGDNTLSFRSVNFPKRYLRHQESRVKLQDLEDDELFKKDASFKRRNGLAKEDCVSFESLSLPGCFIRHKDGELWVEKNDDSELFAKDATFCIVEPFFTPFHPLAGVWKASQPGRSELKWYITADAGKLEVQELGQDFACAKTATYKDGHFVAHFEVGRNLRGYWELDLNEDRTEGKGKTVYTHFPKDYGFGEKQERAGRVVRVIEGVTIKRITSGGFGDDWRIEYIPSHRITQVLEWSYTYPDYESTRWFIARAHPHEVPWIKDVEAKMELLTSDGWKPFELTREESPLKRLMFRIDYPHDDPKLKNGFTARRTVTATICEQKLEKGRSEMPVPPLGAEEEKVYLRASDTLDFKKPAVKKWMDDHKMWIRKDEPRMDFALRIRRELIDHIPYEYLGVWGCSRVLKMGCGECFGHSAVATSIMRANKIPARINGGQWADDENSSGGHCWMEVFVDGVGWVTCDSTCGPFGDKGANNMVGAVEDWVYDAGPFGKQTASIEGCPAFWAQGKGSMDKCNATESGKYKVIKKFR